jgi:hypothetical protein
VPEVPAGHVWHTGCAAAAFHVPRGHCTQAGAPSGEKLPAAHPLQLVAPVTALAVPAVHGEQSAAPAPEKRPGEQSAHVLEEEPTRLLFLPAGHATHLPYSGAGPAGACPPRVRKEPPGHGVGALAPPAHTKPGAQLVPFTLEEPAGEQERPAGAVHGKHAVGAVAAGAAEKEPTAQGAHERALAAPEAG